MFAINADTEGMLVKATTLDAGAGWKGLVGTGGGSGGLGMVTGVSILDFTYTTLASGAYDATYVGSAVPRYVRMESIATTIAPIIAVGIFSTSTAAVVERGVSPVPAPASMPRMQAWAQYWLGITVAGVSVASCLAAFTYKRFS